ncbi:MAG: hypothetical protein HY904_19435 [Deltaproteobacteria bacterium]|nr:hypothetical protein [Deltaproteobacteria bacterium]
MKRWPLVLGLWLGVSTAVARTVTIMPFEPVGVTQEQADMLDGYFRDAAARLPGVDVMTLATTRELLDEAAKGGWKTDLSPTSLTRLTPMMNSEAYVTGHVSHDAVGLKAVIRLVHAGTANEEKRTERSVIATGTDPAAGMRSAAVELLQPALFRGAIDVVCPSPGLQVVLGTESQGECRDSRLMKGLVPGSQTVRVRKDGFSDAQRRVEVLFDRTTVVRVRETAGGLVIDVDSETREGGGFTELPAVATTTPAVRPGVEATKKAGGGVSPLLVAGAAVAVVGAPVILLGVVAAVAAGALTAAWPRSNGRPSLLPWEDDVALVLPRVLITLAVVPLGMIIAVAGLGLGGGGIGLMVAGLVMNGGGE